ncbi:MAG: DNRLRE domain-containing protein [Planctomycetota bacterium]
MLRIQHHLGRIACPAALALACSTASSHAATLTPEADAFIRGGSNANNTQNGTAAQNLLILPGNDLSFARKTYIRFDLSTITAAVTDAELSIDFSFSNTATGGLPINIYGINDGVTGEDTWSEATLTWNNAPSNLTSGSTSAVASGVIASETTLLGSYTPTGAEISGAQNPNTVNFTLDSAALLDLVQNDTNDAITLIITGNSGSNGPVRPFIASRENVGGGGVSLNLTVIPEPASLVLLSAGGMLMLTRRRRQA